MRGSDSRRAYSSYSRRARVLGSAATLLLLGSSASAFGVAGHRAAGYVAELDLCPAAAAAVAELGGGADLGRLGLWADRIRGSNAYAHTGPWHYVNMDDAAVVAEHVHPPEGDVLWAIEHFAAVLAGRRAGNGRDALKFLVHFVVDLHQPLHVGRAEDRGGNTIEVGVGAGRANLHRVWDTLAVESDGRTQRERHEHLRRLIATRAWVAGEIDVDSWAQESLDLRSVVYSFDAAAERLDAAYIERALAISEQRLALAGLRLAAMLNGIYCR